MNSIRFLASCTALAGLALLGGCAGTNDGYYGGPAYGQPYYYPDPAPSVYIGGGSYERNPRYYPRPYYQGRAYPNYPQQVPVPPVYGPGRPLPPAPVYPGRGQDGQAPGGWDPHDPDHGPGRGADRP
jgi:hypothetical protein